MNKSQRKFIRKVKEQIEQSQRTGHKSRLGYLPTLAHGAITPPRDNSIPVVTKGNRVDLDAYEDYE